MRTIATFAALAVFALALHAAEPAQNAPKIRFESTTHDFGNLPQHTTREHTFVFRNVGTAPLKIERITTTCGCTAALASSNELAPDEAGELKVTFKTEEFRGPVTKVVNVYTNDPQNRHIRLTINGNIIADLLASTSVLNFGAVAAGDKRELSTKVFSPTGKKFKILNVRPSLNFLSAAATPSPDGVEGTAYNVTVRIETPPPSGNFSGSVLVETDMKEVPELRIIVSGYTRARTEVNPPRLFFGVVNLADGVERSVTVKANGWDELKVLKIDAPDWLSVSSEEVAEGTEWKLTARIKPDAPDGMLRGSMVVHLNDEQLPEIEVTVHALVRK